jgi:hypothetical protein
VPRSKVDVKVILEDEVGAAGGLLAQDEMDVLEESLDITMDFSTTNMNTLEKSAFSEMRREVFGSVSSGPTRPLSNWDDNALDAASSMLGPDVGDDGDDAEEAWAEVGAGVVGRGVSRRTVEELSSFTPLTLGGFVDETSEVVGDGQDGSIDASESAGIGGKGFRAMLPLPAGGAFPDEPADDESEEEGVGYIAFPEPDMQDGGAPSGWSY